MSEDFVRKNVYDANMAEIRALMAASEARHERLATEIKANNEIFRTEFRGEIKTINTRIDDLRDNQSQALTKWGIIVAVVVGVVQVFVALFLR